MNKITQVESAKDYDLLVFIGRFQPLHIGHQHVIDRALQLSKKVLILVGSANAAPNTRNPFTFAERKEMLHTIYPQLIVEPLNDHTYNNAGWIAEVQNTVKRTLIPNKVWSASGMRDFKIGLIGFAKDHSSYYLKMFPDWANENVEQKHPLDATAIRHYFFTHKAEKYLLAQNLDVSIAEWLVEYAKTEQYSALRKDFLYLDDYHKDWGRGPFLTADTLVQVGGKILLIKRGKEYGHGLYALPGGFVNKNETFKECALRELREETNLRVPLPVLAGSIHSSRTFDEPHRSERGRIITQCYHISLENDIKLPEVRGGDDADSADWYDISWVLDNPQLFFEDHWHIIKRML